MSERTDRVTRFEAGDVVMVKDLGDRLSPQGCLGIVASHTEIGVLVMIRAVGKQPRPYVVPPECLNKVGRMP